MVSANQWVSQHGTGGVLAVAICSGLWLALFNVLSAWGSWDSLLHLAVTLGYAALQPRLVFLQHLHLFQRVDRNPALFNAGRGGWFE